MTYANQWPGGTRRPLLHPPRCIEDSGAAAAGRAYRPAADFLGYSCKWSSGWTQSSKRLSVSFLPRTSRFPRPPLDTRLELRANRVRVRPLQPESRSGRCNRTH